MTRYAFGGYHCLSPLTSKGGGEEREGDGEEQEEGGVGQEEGGERQEGEGGEYQKKSTQQ